MWYLQLPLVLSSWRVGVRDTRQFHVLPVQVPVAVKAFDANLRLVCESRARRGEKVPEGAGEGERSKGREKERGEPTVRRDGKEGREGRKRGGWVKDRREERKSGTGKGEGDEQVNILSLVWIVSGKQGVLEFGEVTFPQI